MTKKIYLLSGGDKKIGMFNEEQKEMLKNDLIGKKTLVSIGAKRDYKKNDIYFYGDENTLGTIKSFNFSNLTEFFLIDERINKEEGLELLKKADIIYLQGGDPFVQLRYIKVNGYDDFLKNYNGIILGLSAGAMNLGKIAFYSKDNDYTQTTFYEALGLIDLTIDPHFDIKDKGRVQEAIEGSKTHKIIGLPDYSLIIINKNGNYEEFGVNYKFENGVLLN